jgi:predicted nucleic acid-binding protein
MKIFVDANILVSVLNKEYPLFPYAARILSLIDNPKFEVFTSPVCLAIAFYFSEKKNGRAKAKEKIKQIGSRISIAVIDGTVVQKASSDKLIDDFEDGMQYYGAIQSGCRCIVTENVKDFHFSKIEVLTAPDFLVEHVASQTR